MYKSLTNSVVITSILIVTYLFITAHIFSHDSILIETDEPIDDIVIICLWSSVFESLHGGYTITKRKSIVTKSGVKASCGIDWLAGVSFSRAVSYNYTLHPTYTISGKRSRYGTINATVMEKATVTFTNLEDEYNKSDQGSSKFALKHFLEKMKRCGISTRYLENYNKTKSPDYITLKNRYYDDIYECNTKNEETHHKHGSSTDLMYYANYGRFGEELVQCGYYPQHCKGEKHYLPERTIKSWVDAMWSRKTWDPYLQGSDEERDLLIGKKKITFIVGYDLAYSYTKDGPLNHPREQVGWLLIDAYTRDDIKNTYNDYRLTVFDTEPTWLVEYNKEKFIKDCDGHNLHLDTDTGKISDELYRYIHNTVQDIRTSYCKNKNT